MGPLVHRHHKHFIERSRYHTEKQFARWSYTSRTKLAPFTNLYSTLTVLTRGLTSKSESALVPALFFFFRQTFVVEDGITPEISCCFLKYSSAMNFK